MKYLERRSQSGRAIALPNLWRWDIMYKAILLAAVTCTLVDIVLLTSGDASHSNTGQFGFVTTLRETRRTYTPRTYARARGQLIRADMIGLKRMGPRGVGLLEDGVGGFIAGPLKLWRNGFVQVVHKPLEQNVPNVTISNFRDAGALYWDDGSTNPCADRELVFHNEVFEGVEGSIDQVYLGFSKIDCSKAAQVGFLTVLSAPYHGGALAGRIYKIGFEFGYELFPENTTSYDGTLKLTKMKELGGFIEDRGYARRSNDILRLTFLLLPLVLWALVKARMGRAMLTVNTMEAKSGKMYKMEGRISPRTMETWSYPLGYVLLGFIMYSNSAPLSASELNTVRLVATEYNNYRPNYNGCAALLFSQEVIAWILYLASFAMSQEAVTHINKGVIYGYQRCRKVLFALAATNIAGAAFVVVDILLGEDTKTVAIYIILGGVVVFLNLIVVIWGIKNHEYDGTTALSTVACLNRASLNVRGVATALAATHVQLSSGVKLMSDEKQGASFRGSVVDALCTASPGLLQEAAWSGANVETRLVEKQTENIDRAGVLKRNHKGQFELLRHWQFHGTQDCILA